VCVYLQVTLLLDSDEIERVLSDTTLLYMVLQDREALGKVAKKIKPADAN